MNVQNMLGKLLPVFYPATSLPVLEIYDGYYELLSPGFLISYDKKLFLNGL